MSQNISTNFWTSANWEQGFTGKLDIINNGNNVNGWTIEFDAPFEIYEIWDGEIVSHEGDHYVIRNLNYNRNCSITTLWRSGKKAIEQEGDRL